jgi:phosphoribosylglycinamide formyltransferase-1
VNRRIAVLISGRGSNLQSIIDAIGRGELAATIAVVVSNRADAGGLLRAREAGIETQVLDHREYGERSSYDRAIVNLLKAQDVSLVCLAGFMRLVGPTLLEAFPNAVLNIHPSLLPSFPGVDAQKQALDHGVRFSGATVHLVTGELDNGPIVAQAAVPVFDDDTRDVLAARILIEEHKLYPEAIRTMLDGGWRVEGRKFLLGRPQRTG